MFKRMLAILLTLAMVAANLPGQVLATALEDLTVPAQTQPAETPEETQEETLPAEIPEETIPEAFGSLSVTAQAPVANAVASGKCGANLSWTLDDEGTLTISGTGVMYSYGTYDRPDAPWIDYTGVINRVVINQGVTTIGKASFRSCSYMTSITIPDGVTSIGESAFYNCRYLSDVTIPNSVTSIEAKAFYWCSSLTSIVIPDTVTSIGASAFCRSGLTSVTISDNIPFISGEVFGYCIYLTSVTIPDGVTSIGGSAFRNCIRLTSVFIPDNVTIIGSEAFSGCSSLSTVTIGNSVTSIGSFAFEDCTSLTDVYYDGTQEQWQQISIDSYNTCLTNATMHCKPAVVAEGTCGKNLTWTLDNEGVLTISGTGPMDNFSSGTAPWYDNRNSINSVVIGDGVTTIGGFAFHYYHNITSVTIGNSVKSIGNCAFYGCDSLTGITIPKCVTTIGYNAFHRCDNLTGIWVDAENPCYSSDSLGVLFNKDKTTLVRAPHRITGSYAIPDSVTSIVDFAFHYCNSLTGITIPDSVTAIGEGMFSFCDSLTSIAIPDSVTTIGMEAFYRCISLTSVTLGNSVTTIGHSAFYDCHSLTSVTIPGSVTTVDVDAFECCTSLSSIDIPSSVTTIGDGAFHCCDGLTDVYYSGTLEQWQQINIGNSNEDLTNATLHCKSSYVAEGTCGENLTWTLDEEGTLTISGTGSMYHYSYNVDTPWCDKTDAIKTVVIEDGVTNIGNCALYLCENLSSVVIGNSVEIIGESAFRGCSGLTDIIIPDSVTKICEYAFNWCDNLISITIPDSVTTIGEGAFGGCSSLTSFTIPGRLTTIDEGTFGGCSGLTSITIPDSVTEIGNNAFIDCSRLTSITIPASVTTMGTYAFNNCDSLTSVTVQGCLTRIGEYAFWDCDSLTSITIPVSVTSIDTGAFWSCESLTDVYYGGTQEQWQQISIGSNNTYLTNATLHCQPAIIASGTCGDNLTWTLDEEGTLIISGTGAMTDYTVIDTAPWRNNSESIKSVVISDGVTTIGEWAFGSCLGLTSITLPNSLTVIGDDAFFNCCCLKSIAVPGSVTSIGDGAFSWCYDLSGIWVDAENQYYSSDARGVLFDKEKTTLVTAPCEISGAYIIPDSVTVIGKCAFAGCGSLTGITIPDSVTTICLGAFQECNALTSVTIPASVTAIPDSAFAHSGLTSITIPDSVTTIGSRAFCGCDSLTSITIPRGVTTIASCTFEGCGLTSITIPDSVTCIDGYAFDDCDSLTSITIPASVTSIGDSVFSACDNLTGIWVDSNNAYYTSDSSGVLFNKDKTILLAVPGGIGGAFIVPDGVTTIGEGAFSGCSRMTSINISDSVSIIDYYAFFNCVGLSSITIPASVTIIGNYAFYYCDSLTNVYYGGTQEQWQQISIGSRNSDLTNATLHCQPAIIASGTCGENLTWTLDEEGTLTISGTGAMTDYNDVEDGEFPPWHCDDPENSTIKKVIIEDGVTTIGNFAFVELENLTEVVIPETVTSIGDYAFALCIGLKEVIIPETVTSIGDYAFMQCIGLKEVIIPGSVKEIGEYAFAVCTSLYNVIISNGVTTIGAYAFGATPVVTVTIPTSVASIGDGVFVACNNLQNVFYLGTSVRWVMTEVGNNNAVLNACVRVVGAPVSAAVKTPPVSNEYLVGESVELTGLVLEVTFSNGVTYDVVGGYTAADYDFSTVGTKTVTVCYEGLSATFDAEVVAARANGISVNTLPNKIRYGLYEEMDPAGLILNVHYTDGSVQQITEGFEVSAPSFSAVGTTTVTVTYRDFTATFEIEVYNGGSCGENLTWELADNGVLTVSGTGAMDSHPWYNSKHLINEVIILEGATTIASSAFASCYNMTSITIPETVETIGSYAFEECDRLTEIDIPDSVKTISDFAFEGCDRLTEINIPDNVETIGDYAFYWCNALSKVNIQGNMASIGDYAFYRCNALTEVNLQSGVVSIGSYAFSYCEKLTKVTFSDTVETIGENAFFYCTSLTSISIPGNGNTTIESSAFFYCISLARVALGNGVVAVEDKAFVYCVNLNAVTIGSGLKEIGLLAFGACPSVLAFVVDEENETFTNDDYGVLFTKDKSQLVVAPGALAGSYTVPSSVTMIWQAAFGYCMSLTDVTLPEGITRIWESLFEGCEALTSVTIPAGVTEIGNSAFSGCTALTSVTIPASMTTIGEDAFDDCSALTDVYYDGLSIQLAAITNSTGNNYLLNAQIHAAAFTTGTCGENLEWTLTEDGLMTISGAGDMKNFDKPEDAPWYVLRNGIKTVVVEEGVCTIGSYAFANYTSITSLTGSSTLSRVVGSAFRGCTALTTVTLAEGTTSIGGYTFYSCSSLRTLYLPKSLTTVSGNAFASCYNLEEIYYSGSATQFKTISIGANNAYFSGATLYCVESNVTGITVKQLPNKTTYALGERLVTTGLVLTVSYTDGTTADITSGFGVGVFDSGFAGEKTVSVTYSNCSTSFVVTVIDANGFCGNDLVWKLDGKGVLTISGTGEMWDFSWYEDQPWYERADSIKHVIIGDGVTTIGVGAFSYCDNLTSLTLSNSVTDIGCDAFYSCSNLTSVTIGHGLANIDYDAFGYCNKLSDVYYIGTEFQWQKIDDAGGNSCLNNATIHFIGNTACGENLTWTLNEEGVLTISGTGEMWDYEDGSQQPWSNWHEEITRIVIEDGVTTIGCCAFEWCYNLTSVSIGNSVTAIGDSAFASCLNLPEITIPASVTSIGKWVFGSCSNLSGIWVDEENEFFSSDATGVLFNKDKTVLVLALEGLCGEYVIPDGVVVIGHSAFSGCEGLTEIIIPDGVTTIGQSAFSACTGLTTVTLPDSIVTIGRSAFSWCLKLTDITIPVGVTTIGASAFEECSSLTRVTIPDGVTTIGASAFSWCSNLNFVAIPASVTTIGNSAFSCCSSLTRVTIPDGVTTIGNGLFSECTSLTGVTIPASVTTIGDWAFQLCSSLTDVYYSGTEEQWQQISIGDGNNYLISATLHTGTCVWHTYDDQGECVVCGEYRAKFSGASLTMEDNLSVNFKVDPVQLDGTGYTDPYVLFTFNGQQFKVTEYTLDSNGRYVFTFSDIAPRMMNDVITAKLYATYQGEEVVCQIRTYSVKEYCYNMLSRCNEGGAYATNTKFKTLLVNLLNYGEAAQLYGNYQVDTLVTADMTETQKNWATQTNLTLGTVQSLTYETIKNPSVTWKAGGLLLEDSVTMRFKFAADSIEGLTVKFATASNRTGWTVDASEFVETTGGYYVYFDGLKARQMRDSVYVTVYRGETMVSNTVRYSIESYAYAKQNDSNAKLVALLEAMMKYGDSAYKYIYG